MPVTSTQNAPGLLTPAHGRPRQGYKSQIRTEKAKDRKRQRKHAGQIRAIQSLGGTNA